MQDPTTFFFKLPSQGRPSNATIPEAWYPGVQHYWERSTSSRIYDPILGIKAVVIHATAGSSSAGAISVMRDGKASFHWLVPDEDEPQHGTLIWACAPEARAAWHVLNSAHHPEVNDDAQRVNHWSVGVEIVNAQSSGDSFSEWQVEATARIVRYCWAKYPNLRYVVSHAKLDPGRRSDPGRTFPWDRFKALVVGLQDEPVSPLVALAVSVEALQDGVEYPACCRVNVAAEATSV